MIIVESPGPGILGPGIVKVVLHPLPIKAGARPLPGNGAPALVIMTTKLMRILTNFTVLIKDWQMRQIGTEEEFIEELRTLVDNLDEELEKNETPVVEE